VVGGTCNCAIAFMEEREY